MIKLRKDKIVLLRYSLLILAIAGLVAALGLYVTPDEFADLWTDVTVDTHQYDQIIERAGLKHEVDPRLIRAVIYQESGFRAKLRGKAGEIGLMQIMPTAAVADWAKMTKQPVPGERELFKPELNVEIGTWYLARGLRRWRNYRCRTELALCQYNAGESRAVKWAPKDPEGAVVGRITINSTKSYVTKIMRRYHDFSGDNAQK